MANEKNKPLKEKEDIQDNADHKIDQDFHGYPHGPANEETIAPKNRTQEKVAGIGTKDGEKVNIPPDQRSSIDEQESDGSANAFDDK
jgi:hypothetical protein